MGVTTPTISKPVDDGLLRGFWYPALRSAEIHGRDLREAMLLGVPLSWAARRQASPSLCAMPVRTAAIPFSDGNFDGNLVECCYHGWKFEPVSGQCREIPSLMPDSKVKAGKDLRQSVSGGGE